MQFLEHRQCSMLQVRGSTHRWRERPLCIMEGGTVKTARVGPPHRDRAVWGASAAVRFTRTRGEGAKGVKVANSK